ncbi:MAG: hypothetical protein A2Z20_11625 [Bdellovibrionales bacterium RBG_16_40_8]|nr:MAG: hypothetical protein A2Z20_11625 [Bdellovibrionales bacterium RBG_16_40_8]
MTASEQTINRLQHLENFYRRGYRSDIIDRSIDKIIALEKIAAQRDKLDLQEKLRKFEEKYQLSSEDFYSKFRKGEMGDALDFVEWSVFYEMWESVHERLKILEAELA